MNAFNLMALSESAKGFQGGAAVDTLPHLTLEEAVNELPVMILREQCDFQLWNMAQSESMTEAAVNAMINGTSFDADALAESFMDTVKEKIKSFFEKLKKFLSSIIAKIKLQIDKLFMSGSQLYARYADKLKGRDFKGMTFNGYKFKKEVAFKDAGSYIKPGGIRDLISSGSKNEIVSPSEFMARVATKKADVTAAKKVLDNMDVEPKTLSAGFATNLTGSKNLGEDWRGTLRDTLYGEKVDLKYGTDFTAESVSSVLKEQQNLNELKDGYQNLLNAVTKDQEAITREAEDMAKVLDNATEVEAKSFQGQMNSLAGEYYTKYLNIYKTLSSTISEIQSIRVGYETAKYNQNAAIFKKMISYNGKSGKNEDASTDVDDFDFDLM